MDIRKWLRQFAKGSALLVTVLLVVLSVTASPAAAAQCNSSSLAKMDVTVTGGMVTFRVPEMTANWDPSIDPFLLKSTWIRTSRYGSWIEAGFTDGAFNGGVYHGHYWAYGHRNSFGVLEAYQEFAVDGPSTAVDTNHTYKIYMFDTQYKYWSVEVDGAQYAAAWYDSTWSGGTGHHVGWETGAATAPYTNFSYDSPNSSSAASFLSTSGVWTNWDSRAKTGYTTGCQNATVMPKVSFTSPTGVTDYKQAWFTHP